MGSAMLTLFIEDDLGDVTMRSISPYEETEEPTTPWRLEKSDAIWEAQERLRLGEAEAAGVWLLVAEGL